MGEYYALWKFPKSKAQRATYDAPNLQTLLRMLDKAEGVSPATTDMLVIHYHASDGQVMEVVSHDKETGFMSCDYSHNLPVPVKDIPIKKKPHIRIPATPVAPSTIGGSGLYQAYQA